MRKRVFVPLLVCCLAGLAAAQRPAPATKSLLPVIATAQYDNARTGANDRAGNALRFTIPSIANGRVYVPTKRRIDVYGLLSATKSKTK